jgi:hypothetical protein
MLRTRTNAVRRTTMSYTRPKRRFGMNKTSIL